MRSFASITTLASLAFAAIASALPQPFTRATEGAAVADVNQAISGIHARGYDTPAPAYTGKVDDNKDGKIPDYTSDIATPDVANPAEPRALPVILVDLTVKMEPLCHQLTGLVTGSLEVTAIVDAALPILTEIKTLLFGAVAEIKLLVAKPIEGVLVLEGKVLDVHAVAELYAKLCTTVILALGIIVKAVVSVKVDVVLGLVVEIVTALTSCVVLGVKLAAGLLVELTPLLHVVAPVVAQLKIGGIANLLQFFVKI